MEVGEEGHCRPNSLCKVQDKKANSKKPKKSIEAIQATCERKKHCLAKALNIVSHFSEEVISESCLVENLQFINQEQFQDIVEERAINKLCGYPPCSSHLQNIPTKKYHISTVQNKVFDITDRKNFCSNMCFKASKFLKDQILTSPLWLRENIPPVVYKLISLNSNSGTVGDEVDLGFTPVKIEVDDLSSKAASNSSTSSENFEVLELSNTEVSTMGNQNVSGSYAPNISSLQGNRNANMANEISYLQVNNGKEAKNSSDILVDMNNSTTITLKSNGNNTDCESDQRADTVLHNNIKIEARNEANNATNKESVQEKRTEKKSLKNKNSPANDVKHKLSLQSIVKKIEHTLREWFSVDSFCFIFGEEKLRELLAEKNDSVSELTSRKMDTLVYEKYLAICRKLNILEIEDSKMDIASREECKKPLPDYEALKEEAKELDLKVRMFYKGDKVVQFNEPSKDRNDISEEPVLPLVDLHAQKALRRRIVTDKIRRVLQDLQKSLCLRGFNLLEEIQKLIHTFDLSSHNITMRPAEWTLMAIFLIKLLSVKDKALEQAFTSNPTHKYLTLLLMSYSLDSGYLDRLVVWLADLEPILQKNS